MLPHVMLWLISLLTFSVQMQRCFQGAFTGEKFTSHKNSIHCNIAIIALHFLCLFKQASHEPAQTCPTLLVV